jgi:hypothetical protein
MVARTTALKVASTLRSVGGTIGAVARAVFLALIWGVALAAWYHAPLVHGAWVGLWAWGPAIVLSARWRDATPAPETVDGFGP